MANNSKASSGFQNYPSSIEEKLGFDKIREMMQALCKTQAAQHLIAALPFLSNQKEIEHQIQSVLEVQNAQALQLFFSTPEQPDYIQELLAQTGLEGAYLMEEELHAFHLALSPLQHNYLIFQTPELDLTRLNQIGRQLESLQDLIRAVDQIIDAEGKIKPQASDALWQIHKKISQKEKDVRRLLQSKFELAKKNGWAGDTEITIRNERLVIPIIAEHKKKMPGFVHDDSQSGKFLYIEPIECFEENNVLKELYFEKKKEIELVLRQITSHLASHKNKLQRHLQAAIQLDAFSARASFCKKIDARPPLFVDRHDACHLINARHPLLFLLLNKNNKAAVPLNFHFKQDHYLVLISGPNAGGKSIALKTIGLLQYLYQTGHPIPADPDSKISIYKKIFIDIGDNQSLENNLSSYSSHLMNMKFFMEHAGEHTLYLIDEMGNGTDPAIGSTMAQAILEDLLSKKAIGIVTTHFGNLKTWASVTAGVQNARMLYDLQHLEPLFILEPDKAGSSFALEVATKAGLSKEIIKRARSINHFKQQIDLDELLAENEKFRKELGDAQKRLVEREHVLNKLISEYESLKTGLLENKQQILQDAKGKASELLAKTNQQIETTIRSIKEHQAEKNKTKQLREEIVKLKKEVEVSEVLPSPVKETPNKKSSIHTALQVGSVVKHQNHPVSGEILQIKKGKAEVLFGQITMWLPLSELIGTLAEKKQQPKTATFNTAQFNKQTNFRAELDIRGVRGEEAIEKLDAWLHDAHLLSMHTLRVIHGRGFGILRKLIHAHLKSLPYVLSFEHESEQMGGDGVTLIKIK